MKTLLSLGLALFALVSGFRAAAMSGTLQIATEGQPVSAKAEWPKGVLELVNDSLRTTGWNPFFSEWPNDVDYYAFNARNMDEINGLAAILAAIKAPKVQILLSPATDRFLAFTTRLEKSNDVAAVFSIGNQARINQWFENLPETAPGVRQFGVNSATNVPEALPPTLTLYLTHPAANLKKLRVPPNVEVRAAISDSERKTSSNKPLLKEIDDFIARHGLKGAALSSTERVALLNEAHRTSLPSGHYTGVGQRIVIAEDGKPRYKDNLNIAHFQIETDGGFKADFPDDETPPEAGKCTSNSRETSNAQRMPGLIAGAEEFYAICSEKKK